MSEISICGYEILCGILYALESVMLTNDSRLVIVLTRDGSIVTLAVAVFFKRLPSAATHLSNLNFLNRAGLRAVLGFWVFYHSNLP